MNAYEDNPQERGVRTMSLPLVVERYLRHHHLVVREHEHAPTCTARELAEVDRVPESMVAKTVFFWCDGQMVMGVIPANRHLNLHETARSMGAQDVRLATESEIAQRISTLQLGSIPPFGSLFGLPVVMDRALMDCETIEAPGGISTEALKMSLQDYMRAEAPEVLTLTRRVIRPRGRVQDMREM